METFPKALAVPATPRRGPLRLVRLRLRLALLTVAVVPLAISFGLVYAITGGHADEATSRVAGESTALASKVAADLERMRTAVVLMAADPALVDVASHRDASTAESRASLADARSALLTVTSIGGDQIPLATLLDDRGRARLRAAGGTVSVPDLAAASDDDSAVLTATMALAPGEAYRSRPYVRTGSGSTGERWITFAARLSAAAPGGRPAGVLRFEVALAPMLRAAAPGLVADGRYAALLESSSGAILGDTLGNRGPADAGGGEGDRPAIPGGATLRSFVNAEAGGQLTDGAFVRDGWLVGATRLTSLGASLPGWTVLSMETFAAPPVPIELLGLLLALSLMLFLITRWMAHQILRPAEQLEDSRSEMRRLYEAAKADSLRDGLTQLGNHRAFQEELERQLEWYRRYHVPVSLLLIDLDDLKLVNDSLGHGAGDAVLRETGRQIADSIRYADRAFRIGGDEFAVLMPHTDAAGALLVGRRLLASLMRSGPERRAIAFSGGVSACPGLATSRAQLYAQADAALYWCKRHGRASVDVYEPVRDREAEPKVAEGVSGAIARVVTERLLRPVYQPIVNLANGRIIGYEGLIRPTAESGFPNPSVMFEAAEAVGRTVELDHACMETVIEGARAIAPDLWLTVNLSPRSIEAADFTAESVLTLLRRHGIAPQRVVVELTERENVKDLERVRHNLLAIQAAGMRIAADDVGAGNAGLRLLSQVRFDIVKIDLALVQEGASNQASRAVLRSLVDLARGWNAYLIAEGLETAAQLRVVRELGVDSGQGYLLGKPQPEPNVAPIDIEELLRGMRTIGGAVTLQPPRPGPLKLASAFVAERAHPAVISAAIPTIPPQRGALPVGAARRQR